MTQHRRILLGLTVLAWLALAGCSRSSATAVPTAAPILHPVFRTLTRIHVWAVSVDPSTGTLYGASPTGVIALATHGQVRHVYARQRNEYVCNLAVDGADHHLLLSAIHFDHAIGPANQTVPEATDLARVVDGMSGRVLSTIAVFHGHIGCPIIAPPLVTLDPVTGRGFVSDAFSGATVLVDIRSGALVRRFHIPLPTERFEAFPSDALPYVVDTRWHRLIVSVSPNCSSNCHGPTLVTLDTMEGRVVRMLYISTASPRALALDAANHRIYFVPPIGYPGDLFTLDARSGAIVARLPVIHTIPAPQQVGNVAVDPRTHYVYLYVGGLSILSPHHNRPAHLLEVNGRGTRVVRDLRLPNAHLGYPAGMTLIDPATRRLFVQVGKSLLVIDASSLRRLQTISLDPLLHGTYDGVTLDTINHRLLVFGNSGIVVLNER